MSISYIKPNVNISHSLPIISKTNDNDKWAKPTQRAPLFRPCPCSANVAHSLFEGLPDSFSSSLAQRWVRPRMPSLRPQPITHAKTSSPLFLIPIMVPPTFLWTI
ncbi:hypothetical protein M406DRAFT_103589 [Cryphonectria parasitica EP155]|uniref:Uncharacterized protein n=1 Tax=Cryphonectria parasitica (strain ATCC 38755 / EP155) TaxID=660469 RepID=A0A9P5CKJ2_CRYP1|nr:uncharacterized protein M406DRAFT_103589 [Cryphonectria parasitica EP155]KAF3761031.1 hypothetical protein M406DRAFT_103589 [Cryphonectria parasitica EP155]